MKAFCLVCLNLSRKDWCMGYCREKEHYIHKPHRRCSKYWESSNVKDDPEWMLSWHETARDLANEKYEMVSQFIEKGEENEG